MTKTKYTQKILLLERIERNYDDFKKLILQSDREDIFALASSIAAVNDVYSYLTTYDWADDDETEYLLLFENPLKLLADVWKEKSQDRDDEFSNMLVEVTNDSEYTDNYITVTFAGELRDKYGDDIPIEAAIVCEIVELGRKLYKYEH